MKKPIFPQAISLRPSLGAFTPSDPITKVRKDRIEKNIKMLMTCDLAVKFSEHAFCNIGHISATAQDRSSDIHSLVSDTSIHALIATCGGKCSNALLPLLDYKLILDARKPFIGFSDVGVILNAITAKTGLITFYGPNVLSKLEETEHYSLKALQKVQIEAERKSELSKTIVGGKVEGRLTGGNLSTFAVSIAGTEYEPKFDKTILFWESGTRDWKLIDQYISALHIRGVLNRISGMLVGKIGENISVSDDERLFLSNRLKSLGIPILWMPIFGHGISENPIWPIGGLVRLDADEQKLILLEPFVN